MASSAMLTSTHLPQLRAIIDKWTASQPEPKPFFSVSDSVTAQKDILVAFRTRPSLPNEAAEKFNPDGDVDDAAPVEFCSGISVASAEPGVFVAHVPGMKWNGPTLTHKKYECDLAFGPSIDNEEVYQRVIAASELLPLVISGGVGCVLAYGQTGTGKTFTMEGLESRIARDIFKSAQATAERLIAVEGGENPEYDATNMFEFTVTFLELLGRRAADLADPGDVDESGNLIRKEVTINEDKIGNVVPSLISTAVQSSEELEKHIVESLSHRRTSATLRNATSSRSHALLTIWVKNRSLPYAEPGQLILVDLAGSERYEDSKAHDKQRMDESRENNLSLMNLKECVRTKAKMAAEEGFVHIPWRSNKLTMLLKPIFDVESRRRSKTIIIAHVSPHLQDTVHSTNTLGYAAPFKTNPPKPRGPAPYDAKDPRTWNHEDTRSWFIEQFTKFAKKDRNAEFKVKENHARQSGRKLRPIDFNSNDGLNLGVDMDKFCPAGMSASNFAKMYMTEFIEWTLKSRPTLAEGKTYSPTSTAKLKDNAETIATGLFYLVISAKGRTRKEIMASRKKLSVGIYGERPEGAPNWASQANGNAAVSEKEIADNLDAMIKGEEEWTRRMKEALDQALKDGKNVDEEKKRMTQIMIQEYEQRRGAVASLNRADTATQ